jgi:hypothetical protein
VSGSALAIQGSVDYTSFSASGAGNGGRNTPSYEVVIDGVSQTGSATFTGTSGTASFSKPVTGSTHTVQVFTSWAASQTRDGNVQARTSVFGPRTLTCPAPPTPPTPPTPPVTPPTSPPVAPPVETPPVVEQPPAPPVVETPPVVVAPPAPPVVVKPKPKPKAPKATIKAIANCNGRDAVLVHTTGNVERVNWTVGGKKIAKVHGQVLGLPDSQYSEKWRKVTADVVFSNDTHRVLKVNAYVCHKQYVGNG